MRVGFAHIEIVPVRVSPHDSVVAATDKRGVGFGRKKIPERSQELARGPGAGFLRRFRGCLSIDQDVAIFLHVVHTNHVRAHYAIGMPWRAIGETVVAHRLLLDDEVGELFHKSFRGAARVRNHLVDRVDSGYVTG